MTVTDDAVARIRDLIVTGRLQPGDRLPQEAELAHQLGISRNSMREAVRALEQARVLTVRHGSGTYVTSLEPSLLLEGIAFAVDLLQDEQIMEVVEVRQLLEPAATGLAAMRMTPSRLSVIGGLLEASQSLDSRDGLVRNDMEFHAAIVDAAGNQTLSSILGGLASRTMRMRIWGGIISDDPANDSLKLTIDHHRQIFDALAEGNPILAESAARIHIRHARRWLDADLSRNDIGHASVDGASTLPGRTRRAAINAR